MIALIGYMGSSELLHAVAEYIQLIKSKSPHVKYSKYVINENDKYYNYFFQ